MNASLDAQKAKGSLADFSARPLQIYLTLFQILLGFSLYSINYSMPALTVTDTPTALEVISPTPTAIPWNGKKIYAFDTMWGSKGSGLDQMNDPQAIAIGPDGNIFIADSDNNRILVWDKDGKPLQAYGSFGSRADWRDPPQFNHPAGVLVFPNKQIFVADTLNNRIVILDENGMAVTAFGSQGVATGQFNLPRSICRDHWGKIRILDTGNSRVQTFSNLGIFNFSWGTYGTDAKDNTITAIMNLPLGMAINSIDQVIVADTGNSEMEVFNNNGTPVTVQGWYGEDGPYEFKDPSGVAVTPSGVVAIADGASGRVCFYNSRNGDFEFLSEWRAKDDIPNQENKPKYRGIACDLENRLYVTDIQNNCVIRLKPIAFSEETPVVLTPTPTPEEFTPYGGVGYPIR